MNGKALVKEYKMLQELNEGYKTEIDALREGMTAMKGNMMKLKQDKIKLQQISDKLLDDQKEFEMQIQKLRKENEELKMRNIDVQNYRTWNWKQILLWILSLDDGRYSKYEDELRKNLANEEIGGEDLFEVNEADIKGWGVNNFKDKKNLSKRIKELVNQYKPAVGNEGGLAAPTAYI